MADTIAPKPLESSINRSVGVQVGEIPCADDLAVVVVVVEKVEDLSTLLAVVSVSEKVG